MKKTYFKLISLILVFIFYFSLIVSMGSAEEETRRIRTEPGYHKFILTKGRGIEICEAYLKRLNKTWFETLPLCDRPENTEILGFEKLNRVALTAEEIYPIEYRIRDFIWTGNQNIHDKADEMRPENKERAIFFINQGLELQSLGAYRYDPRIDFDNDQKPEDLLVWKESRFSCGSIHEEYGLFPELGRIIVLVLEPDSLSVNEKKTKNINWPLHRWLPNARREGFL